MTGSEREFCELIAAQRMQFDKVREKSAWLELKQSEFRSDDEIAYIGLLEAKEQLTIEQSVIVGHALMVQQDMKAGSLSPDPQTAKMLKDVLNYSKMFCMG